MKLARTFNITLCSLVIWAVWQTAALDQNKWIMTVLMLLVIGFWLSTIGTKRIH
jgi:uncharacterized membrane protein YqjE